MLTPFERKRAFLLLMLILIMATLEMIGVASILPFISVLVDPCYGGVTASLAMLGDLILAEPKARIGFSGKRVIQDTVKEDLPKDFQTAETQLDNGFVDKIIDRKNFREFVDKILTMLQ